MMYARTYPDFWSSRVSDLDDTCRAFAHYLYSARVPTWGLYFRCFAAIAHEFKRPESIVKEAFAQLRQIEYAYFDEPTGWVWVKEMAAWQLRPLPLTPNDLMVKSARRWYVNLPKNPFLGPFWDRYHRDLRLDDPTAFPGSAIVRREWGSPVPVDAYSLLPMPPESVKPTTRADDFERWLSYYPKHKRAPRKPALEAWKRRKIPSAAVDSMIAVLVAQLKQDDWAKEGGKYIPHADTYLKKEMEKDEPIAPTNGPVAWRCPHAPRCATREACDERYYQEEIR